MTRYAAFLRSVNVGGKNTVPMAECRSCFERAGFTEVKTVLNSGNVVFSGEEEDTASLSRRIETMLRERFGFEIPVFVIRKEDLSDLLGSAPEWWGGEDRAIYDNLIFVMPPTAPPDVFREFGAPKDGLETAQECGSAIFWSFSRKEYQKTNWWPKTANTEIGARLTIRTANTVRKVAAF